MFSRKPKGESPIDTPESIATMVRKADQVLENVEKIHTAGETPNETRIHILKELKKTKEQKKRIKKYLKEQAEWLRFHPKEKTNLENTQKELQEKQDNFQQLLRDLEATEEEVATQKNGGIESWEPEKDTELQSDIELVQETQKLQQHAQLIAEIMSGEQSSEMFLASQISNTEQNEPKNQEKKPLKEKLLFEFLQLAENWTGSTEYFTNKHLQKTLFEEVRDKKNWQILTQTKKKENGRIEQRFLLVPSEYKTEIESSILPTLDTENNKDGDQNTTTEFLTIEEFEKKIIEATLENVFTDTLKEQSKTNKYNNYSAQYDLKEAITKIEKSLNISKTKKGIIEIDVNIDLPTKEYPEKYWRKNKQGYIKYVFKEIKLKEKLEEELTIKLKINTKIKLKYPGYTSYTIRRNLDLA
jgi:sulfur carrier protein ThiS